VEAGFQAFNNAIRIHKDSDNNLVYINGQLQMVDITVLDANNNEVMGPLSTQENTLIISSNGFIDGLHYLNIQHKNYPNVRTKTILKQ